MESQSHQRRNKFAKLSGISNKLQDQTKCSDDFSVRFEAINSKLRLPKNGEIFCITKLFDWRRMLGIFPRNTGINP